MDSSEAFPISFYGGPHFIHELDCVKARFAFLKPHKDYEYRYDGLSVYNNEKVHKISFSPAVKSKKIYKGTMYIHAASLSYLRFDMQLTDPGLKQRFNGIFDSQYGLSSLEKTYVVNYQLKDSICYLKSIFENELLQTKDGHLYNSPLELVVTKTKASAIDAIPFRCQLPLAYVPDREASNYFESDWRSYNTLSQVELIDTLSSKKLFENAEQSLSKKDRFLEVFSHLDFSYRLGYQAYHLTKGWRQLDFQEVAFEKNLEDAGTTLVVEGMVAYNLTQRFNIGYLIEVGLGDNNLQDKHGPQLIYKLPLKTMGKNLLLEPQLAYVWHKFGRSVGTQTFDQKFSFGGKDFKQSKVEALPGIRHHGLQIGSSLLYQLSARLYLDMNASYYMASHTEEVLFLQERSGFFLTRKTAFEPLAETEAILTINDEVIQTSGINYDNWAISIGVRIAF
ncbi:MAG: hypothetical protein N4A71_08295 [Carboxylicivirga sp.]|nr:hypothetical protein [Carboxylicivirga sp.]